MASRLVNELRERVLGVAEFADQSLVRVGLFDRVEVPALDIFEQRDLERVGIVQFPDDDGDFVQPRALRRAPATLTGDDLVIATVRPDQDRLEYPARRDRLGQFVERRVVEHAARLAGLRRQRADRQHANARRRIVAASGRYWLGRDVAEERVQPAAETGAGLAGCVGHAAIAGAEGGRRPISSRASAI